MINQSTRPKVSILVVDDDKTARMANRLSIMNLLQESELKADEIRIQTAANLEECFAELRNNAVHVVLLDSDLGEDQEGQKVDGIDHIQEILDIQPATQILVVTGYDDTRLAVKAMKRGACAYIVKSSKEEYIEYRNTQILYALKRAKSEIKRLTDRHLDKSDLPTYICNSPAMQRVEIQLKALAQYSAPVLFLGESGVGKTETAKRLNQLRAEFLGQKDRPFFNINMATIPKELADSTLFGHERGAFTGAIESKQGLFELASGGDLFLDEIGEASLDVQAKLLKVIEEREFCRVGGSKNFKTSAGIIFATNQNLSEMVNQKKFREDLYARICTFDITLPNLSERKEDIPYICSSIINELEKHHVSKKFTYEELPDDLKEYLHRDNIPFNIRGIRNDLERLLISSSTDQLGRLDFSNWKTILGISRKSVFQSKKPDEIFDYNDFESISTKFLTENFPGIKEARELLERKILIEASQKYRTKKEISKALKISESNIIAKMNKFNINIQPPKQH